jgi:predicted amino acid-binding ACT domain protein
VEVGLIAFFCLFLAGISTAAVKQEVAKLEAAENIKDVSQEITKAYFYKHLEIRIVQAKRDIEEGLLRLDSAIKTLSKNVTDDEEQGVLAFVEYARDEMKVTLQQPYAEENGALMLDFSESLLEGATLIGEKHFTKGNAEAAGLLVVKRMEFLLERISKYYIAHKAGFKDYNNVVQLEQAVKEFEINLKKLNGYNYPVALQANTEKINKFWPIAKGFYLGIEKGALPIIVMSSTNNLERALHGLQAYHLKKITTK